jgi:hypothetical protein
MSYEQFVEACAKREFDSDDLKAAKSQIYNTYDSKHYQDNWLTFRPRK